jgi:predicted lactoylglutathione lyase
MATQIYVNLPVKALSRSVEFFRQLGYSFNPEFTNEKAACMVVSDDIYIMLLGEDFFKTFIDKPICDATQSTEVLLCLSFESRDQVDEMVLKALAAGATTPRPAVDHGFMYSQVVQDLDGHLWELMSMAPTAVTVGPQDI